jgi:hypothetical protein
MSAAQTMKHCPACEKLVEETTLVCPACDYDFRVGQRTHELGPGHDARPSGRLRADTREPEVEHEAGAVIRTLLVIAFAALVFFLGRYIFTH